MGELALLRKHEKQDEPQSLCCCDLSALVGGRLTKQGLNTGILVYNLFGWSLAELILQNDFRFFDSHRSNPDPFVQKMKVLKSHQVVRKLRCTHLL